MHCDTLSKASSQGLPAHRRKGQAARRRSDRLPGVGALPRIFKIFRTRETSTEGDGTQATVANPLHKAAGVGFSRSGVRVFFGKLWRGRGRVPAQHT